METLVHADIFFFVTPCVVVVVGLAFTVALIYLVKVLRQVREVIQEVKEEVILVRGDIKQCRENVQQSGWKLKAFVEMVKNIFTFKRSKTKSDQ